MKNFKTIDGNEAAAYISYAFTEVATIYPITPSSAMAEHVDSWSASGKKNLFGQTVKLIEMQSEHGAAGAMHGSLEAGALATSYTASQGLLLMIPAMYRISGQLHPGVLHVSARTVGTHAFSIFGDHSDVMACRQTGFAILSTGSVQEVMDLTAVAHLSAIEGSVPFLHFFDGFRTSHEIQKIESLEYDQLKGLINYDALEKFRKNALNPEYPVQRSTVQNPDIFFQLREAVNPYYDRLPEIVEKYLGHINKITGRDYKLFNYYGAENAKNIIIAMGSVSGVLKETVDYLNESGEEVGYLQIHLYRPFSVKHFIESIPKSVKRISVLDRTKEPGSAGEPLFQDVCTAFSDNPGPMILAGRFGLSSKDVTPAQMVAVFKNMKGDKPKNHFTVGINDDVTHLSLPVGEPIDTGAEGTVNCKFWGLASDGTVGANQNSIKIIGDNTNMFAQAYFEYDTKKSGGTTRSHLRFGKNPIRSSYLVNNADFVACHKQSYIEKYDIVNEIKQGGTFLLNCAWDKQNIESYLPGKVKRIIAQNNIKFYTIDATKIALEIGLGNRTNTVLQAAFFKLSNILPIEEAVELMKSTIKKSYEKKGEKILSMNYAAVDQGIVGVNEIVVPDEWKNAEDELVQSNGNLPDYIKNILMPVNDLKGDSLPVSIFADAPDGTVPLGTSQYEKRGIAINVPQWVSENCIECNQCSLVCPHATVRPFLLSKDEMEKAPEGYEVLQAKGKGMEQYHYRIQIDPLDCTGCGSCAEVCPAKNKALIMKPIDSQMHEMENWNYSLSLSFKENPMDKFSVKGSQFEKPLLEFSGACAGCGETPYMKLMTQLFGDRMYIANATGCTQAWGAGSPCVPYTKNYKGQGPAWSNSLFENNAEFSMGMCLAVRQQRERLSEKIQMLMDKTSDSVLREKLSDWLGGYDESEGTRKRADDVINAVESVKSAESFESGECGKLCEYILGNKEHLVKKSMWMYGGDGWAYDIGYGGLDHVLSTGEDINILVVDTETYSNTGGQSSKATPIGAVAQFAISGKKTKKKDLGVMMMAYGHVYVAQVAMGADKSHLIKILKEAEEYKGPSLIIAYAPCITHGIEKGIMFAQKESKLAVDSGYWHLYHNDPRLKEQGKNTFVLDSGKPTVPLRDFLVGETRFVALERTFPKEAEVLLSYAVKDAEEKYLQYEKMSNQ